MSDGKRTVSKCPACGAPIDSTAMSCPYCDSQYVIEDQQSYNSPVFEEFSNAPRASRIITAAQIMTAYNEYLSKKKSAKTLLIIALIATFLTSGILTLFFIGALINFIMHSNNNPTMENLSFYVLKQHGMPKLNVVLFLALFITFIGAFFYLAFFIQKYNSWKNEHGELLNEYSTVKTLTYDQAVELYK